MQTTAYHPECNGLIEWFHCCLKDTLHTHYTSFSWANHLPWVILSLCSAVREDTAVLPSQAVFGDQ